MKFLHSGVRSGAIRRIGITVVPAAALALIFTMTLPAMTSNRRPVKMLVTPVYPVAAKHMRVSGPVDIDVTVDPKGKVTDVKTLSGDPVLALSAVDAVRKWQFAPSPAGTNENVVINFTYNN